MLDRWYSRYEDSAKMLSSRMAFTGRVYEPRSVRHIADSPHAASPRCVWILDCLRGATDGAPCALTTVVRDSPPLSHAPKHAASRAERNTDERLGSHG